ncbi:MAG TPA: c-type cytochrome [Candidatus Binataceae bacterium]|nr:c-type cytochrome [Candidatus Binataceae bacterium]
MNRISFFEIARIATEFAIAAIFACTLSSSANAQMMGGDMGQMMSGGHMGSMPKLMAWMNGEEISVSPTEPQPNFNAGLLAHGELLYGEHCTICHGAKGNGAGRRADELSPRPRDFTKGVFEFHSTPTGTLPADEDIWKVISGGLQGTAMVPWISLSERDRWALVAYVEGFSPRFAKEARSASIQIPTQPRETPELVEQGKKIFSDAGCVECHDAEGRGDGPSVASLKDASGDPIRPLDFHDGIFRRGSSLAQIFLTVRTGLNGTPMPSYADSLSPDQTWAVAAFVRSLAKSASTMDNAGREARAQQRMGMAIDMPGMSEMPMGGMMR